MASVWFVVDELGASRDRRGRFAPSTPITTSIETAPRVGAQKRKPKEMPPRRKLAPPLRPPTLPELDELSERLRERYESRGRKVAIMLDVSEFARVVAALEGFAAMSHGLCPHCGARAGARVVASAAGRRLTWDCMEGCNL
jgi:hypothetical protein